MCEHTGSACPSDSRCQHAPGSGTVEDLGVNIANLLRKTMILKNLIDWPISFKL